MATATGAINPYSAADLALAQQIIDSANLALELYQHCKGCSLDTADLEARVNAYKTFAEGVQRAFSGSGSPV